MAYKHLYTTFPPKFKPMRAVEPEPEKYPLIVPIATSSKIDGIRTSMLDRTCTRSGKELPNLYLREQFRAYHGLDFEITTAELDNPNLFNLTQSDVMSIMGQPNYVAHAFDCVSCDPRTPFSERMEYVKEIVASVGDPRLVALEQRIVKSQEELDDTFEYWLSKKFEGVIGKRLDCAYHYGKASPKQQQQIKLKPWKDSEALIVDCVEAQENQNEAFTDELGFTKRSSHQENKVGKGMVGSFDAIDIYTGVKFSLSPGSLTHGERTALWAEYKLGLFPKRFKSVCVYRYLPVGQKDKPRMNGFKAFRDLNDIDMSLVIKGMF